MHGWGKSAQSGASKSAELSEIVLNYLINMDRRCVKPVKRVSELLNSCSAWGDVLNKTFAEFHTVARITFAVLVGVLLFRDRPSPFYYWDIFALCILKVYHNHSQMSTDILLRFR